MKKKYLIILCVALVLILAAFLGSCFAVRSASANAWQNIKAELENAANSGAFSISSTEFDSGIFSSNGKIEITSEAFAIPHTLRLLANFKNNIFSSNFVSFSLFLDEQSIGKNNMQIAQAQSNNALLAWLFGAKINGSFMDIDEASEQSGGIINKITNKIALKAQNNTFSAELKRDGALKNFSANGEQVLYSETTQTRANTESFAVNFGYDFALDLEKENANFTLKNVNFEISPFNLSGANFDFSVAKRNLSKISLSFSALSNGAFLGANDFNAEFMAKESAKEKGGFFGFFSKKEESKSGIDIFALFAAFKNFALNNDEAALNAALDKVLLPSNFAENIKLSEFWIDFGSGVGGFLAQNRKIQAQNISYTGETKTTQKDMQSSAKFTAQSIKIFGENEVSNADFTLALNQMPLEFYSLLDSDLGEKEQILRLFSTNPSIESNLDFTLNNEKIKATLKANSQNINNTIALDSSFLAHLDKLPSEILNSLKIPLANAYELDSFFIQKNNGYELEFIGNFSDLENFQATKIAINGNDFEKDLKEFFSQNNLNEEQDFKPIEPIIEPIESSIQAPFSKKDSIESKTPANEQTPADSIESASPKEEKKAQ